MAIERWYTGRGSETVVVGKEMRRERAGRER